eukprot:scaffold130660_cov20-Prasinocladus_malaysianus.AAC.1
MPSAPSAQRRDQQQLRWLLAKSLVAVAVRQFRCPATVYTAVCNIVAPFGVVDADRRWIYYNSAAIRYYWCLALRRDIACRTARSITGGTGRSPCTGM